MFAKNELEEKELKTLLADIDDLPARFKEDPVVIELKSKLTRYKLSILRTQLYAHLLTTMITNLGGKIHQDTWFETQFGSKPRTFITELNEALADLNNNNERINRKYIKNIILNYGRHQADRNETSLKHALARVEEKLQQANFNPLLKNSHGATLKDLAIRKEAIKQRVANHCEVEGRIDCVQQALKDIQLIAYEVNQLTKVESQIHKSHQDNKEVKAKDNQQVDAAPEKPTFVAKQVYFDQSKSWEKAEQKRLAQDIEGLLNSYPKLGSGLEKETSFISLFNEKQELIKSANAIINNQEPLPNISIQELEKSTAVLENLKEKLTENKNKTIAALKDKIAVLKQQIEEIIKGLPNSKTYTLLIIPQTVISLEKQSLRLIKQKEELLAAPINDSELTSRIGALQTLSTNLSDNHSKLNKALTEAEKVRLISATDAKEKISPKLTMLEQFIQNNKLYDNPIEAEAVNLPMLTRELNEQTKVKENLGNYTAAEIAKLTETAVHRLTTLHDTASKQLAAVKTQRGLITRLEQQIEEASKALPISFRQEKSQSELKLEEKRQGFLECKESLLAHPLTYHELSQRIDALRTLHSNLFDNNTLLRPARDTAAKEARDQITNKIEEVRIFFRSNQIEFELDSSEILNQANDVKNKIPASSIEEVAATIQRLEQLLSTEKEKLARKQEEVCPDLIKLDKGKATDTAPSSKAEEGIDQKNKHNLSLLNDLHSRFKILNKKKSFSLAYVTAFVIDPQIETELMDLESKGYILDEDRITALSTKIAVEENKAIEYERKIGERLEHVKSINSLLKTIDLELRKTGLKSEESSILNSFYDRLTEEKRKYLYLQEENITPLEFVTRFTQTLNDVISEEQLKAFSTNFIVAIIRAIDSWIDCVIADIRSDYAIPRYQPHFYHSALEARITKEVGEAYAALNELQRKLADIEPGAAQIHVDQPT